MDHFMKLIFSLIHHLERENIISKYDISEFENKSFYEMLLCLKQILKEHYPNTKQKKMMKSIHYANGFQDEDLKQSAYLLDEIQQYLTIHKFLNHDDCVEFFNKKITEKSFVITPESLFQTHLESLLLSVNNH